MAELERRRINIGKGRGSGRKVERSKEMVRDGEGGMEIGCIMTGRKTRG